jgi:hypothetical protein
VRRRPHVYRQLRDEHPAHFDERPRFWEGTAMIRTPVRASAGVVAALLTALGGVARAEPLAREQVPGPLVPWIDWVLRDAPDAACPLRQGEPERRECAWPSRLALQLDERGGRFRQEWRLYRPGWVALPGDQRIWPEQVRVGDAPGAVVLRERQPAIRLAAGRHVVSGEFHWTRLPEFLPVPAQTGLVSLTLRGAEVAQPERDTEGRLWLERRAGADAAESRLELQVYRRASDEVPLELETLVALEVSGPGREVLIGPALPEGFVPMRLESPLPVRLEPDDRLRVQVRPGSWQLSLQARSRGGPVSEIALAEPAPSGPDASRTRAWDAEEVWVFDARPALRLVQIEGVAGIDPQQTLLPQAWRHLPAYLMQPGSRMRLVQERRGDQDPAPDQLSLHRTLWLDFDGGGYTAHDRIEGTLQRSWRLEAASGLQPGRVSVDGADRFLSRLEPDGPVGVEIRQGQLQVEADSRIEGVRARLPATGWAHDFAQVAGQLQLPPGWRLLHAWGPDEVRGEWTGQWSLLQIFLVLITALSVARLWGRGWGALALATLVLIYLEPGAPRYAWLAALAMHALLARVGPGRLRTLLVPVRLLAVAVLAVTAVSFMVRQARLALYPALERSGAAVRAAQAPPQRPTQIAKDAVELRDQELGQQAPAAREAPEAPAPLPSPVKYDYATDPAALISTGPGLPHWSWQAVEFAWRGPVERSQPLGLLLLPPWAASLLAWLRVALTALLGVCVLDLGRHLGFQRLARRLGAAALASLALLPASASADIPPPELLDELRARLLEPPECAPQCAASPRMQLEVEPSRLRARVELEAAAATAVPLPGDLTQFSPARVLLDGADAEGLARSDDGRLWLPLPVGRHQVLLEGPLPDRDAVQIALPLLPHRVDAQVSGWTLDGLREDGRPEASLQLTRTRAQDPATLEPRQLPAFMRVERTLHLGLQWQVDTTVTRLTPPGQALFLEIPLLAGESVTSERPPVQQGSARVTLQPGELTASWSSGLVPSEHLALRAPDTLEWVELWRVDAAPQWHVEVAGIPPVHRAPGHVRVREWRPWPGEQVELRVSRPLPVEGRYLTIDRAALHVRPGQRASDARLELALRASRGAEQLVELPAGAELLGVSIDGTAQPIRAVERRVALPVRPGAHRAELTWRAPTPISVRYRTPEVDLGAPSVNTELALEVPADRWVLFAGGPRLGPAVLFWSVLAIASLVALGLGRVPLTPLSTTSWFLLFVGLTQVPIWFSLVVVTWLLALGFRREAAPVLGDVSFRALQLLLAAWTIAALCVLVGAIHQGLLGPPDMQIRGNDSSGALLRWYQDRSPGVLARAGMISVPLLVYRLAMLAWALWLALALLGWLRWGWECFCSGGLWRPSPRLARRAPDGGSGA